jgi:hypothetical protein
MSRLLVIASLALLLPISMAQGKKKPLSDAALSRVTAGGVSATVSNGVVQFQGSAETANGLVSGAGTLAVLTGPLTSNTTNGTLTLNGNAQQNLSSLVNINAVNSNINVLLNLTVNMNSSVGTVVQSNLAVKH